MTKESVSLTQGVEFLKQLSRETARAGISSEVFQKAIEDKPTRETIVSNVVTMLSGKEVPSQKGKRTPPRKKQERRTIKDFDEFLERWEHVETTQEAMGLVIALGAYCPAEWNVSTCIPVSKQEGGKILATELYEKKVGAELLKRFQFLRGVAANDRGPGIRLETRRVLWEQYLLAFHVGGLMRNALPIERAFEEALAFIKEEMTRDPGPLLYDRLAEFCLLMVDASDGCNWYKNWRPVVRFNTEKLIKAATMCWVGHVSHKACEGPKFGAIKLLLELGYLTEKDMVTPPDKLDTVPQVDFENSKILPDALVRFFSDVSLGKFDHWDKY